VAELAALGVARVSAGSGLAQAAHALVRRAARELLDTGTYETLADGLDYGELNRLLGAVR
jgi:2-methylisocitrate lyase-like PEP mutase family enzyme